MKTLFYAAVAAILFATSATQAQEVTGSPSTVGTQVRLEEAPLVSYSPVPSRQPYVDWADDQITLTTGTIGFDQALVTYPFRYTRPVRLKNDVGGVWGAKLHAGAVGFEVGPVASVWSMGKTVCFFSNKKAPYTVPQCVRFADRFGLKWTYVRATNNLVTDLFYDDPLIGVPEYEDQGVTIDHDFSLQLKVGRWTKDGVYLSWYSDDAYVYALIPKLNLDASGAATLKVAEGTITLRRDTADPTKTVVTFTPAG